MPDDVIRLPFPFPNHHLLLGFLPENHSLSKTSTTVFPVVINCDFHFGKQWCKIVFRYAFPGTIRLNENYQLLPLCPFSHPRCSISCKFIESSLCGNVRKRSTTSRIDRLFAAVSAGSIHSVFPVTSRHRYRITIQGLVISFRYLWGVSANFVG